MEKESRVSTVLAHPGAMDVIAHPDVAEFWRVAEPLVTADPVRNTVVLTVIARLLLGGRFGDVTPMFFTIHDDDATVIGATFCTPPFPLVVSAVPARAAGALAERLVTDDIALTGVSGTRAEAEAFAAAWTERTGARLAERIDQRLYRLDRLAFPPGVPGEPVVADVGDIDLLTDWRRDFAVEADPHADVRWSREAIERQVEDSLVAGDASLLWLLGDQPVALAVVGMPRSDMSRIGPVYTPEEFRGHGYGSAVTAAAAQWALDQGARHVVLFTDLDNPVSNSIYQRIGFVSVADAMDVSFT
jgi:GNAT superfamily N-acetyltransferase